MRKPVFGVTDKVWHKLGYTATEDGSYGIHCNGCAIYIAGKNGADLQKRGFLMTRLKSCSVDERGSI